MSKNIINLDKDGKLHGKQIAHYSNGDIRWIANYHHGKPHGYRAYFNKDNSNFNKTYWNMDKLIYSEDHWRKEIQIKI